MVTMRDVARRAGVSQTTVSHVVNQSRFVRPDVVDKVEAAIKETGYVNDGIARSLKTGRTGTIGLAMSAMSNPYFGSLVHTIEREVAGSERSLMLVDTHDEPDRELRAVTDLLAWRPDAIMLAASEDPTRTFELLQRHGVPTVLIDRLPAPVDGWKYDAVGTENAAPTAALVDHLLTLGHRRIALLAGRRGLSTTEERIAGFRSALDDANLVVDEAMIRSGYSADDPAATAIAALLEMPDRPTAIVSGNNQITIGAMRHLRDRGLRVPVDMSLVCYDDFEWADLFEPRLTAVRQPIAEIGTRAVEMAFSRIDNPDLGVRIERLPATLVVRDSAAPHPPTGPS